MGADYVVLTSAEISVLDNKFCMVGTGILSRIVLPLPIPIPIPFTKRVEVVEIPVAMPDKCIITVEIGDQWSIVANAQVFKAETCLATNGNFAISRGTNLTLHDGAALRRELVKKTADLFPARATIARMDGDRGVVVAPKGMQTGQVFEVRKETDTSGSLAYVRHVDTKRPSSSHTRRPTSSGRTIFCCAQERRRGRRFQRTAHKPDLGWRRSPSGFRS